MKIQDAHVLLTGGSLGIGRETARLLVQHGAKVVITGRDHDRLQQAAAEIGAIPLVFDIADLDQIPAKASEAVGLLGGRVDVLINNAGIGEFGSLQEVTAGQFERVFRTNVFGLALLTREISGHMKAQSSGTIVNIASTAGLKGFAGGTVYSASKFAVRSMTQSWQAELRRDNIRVCLVNPSEVTTAFARTEREERPSAPNKLDGGDIAHTILSVIQMDDKGFVPEVTVWATNPF